ncbi:hypothetical protein PCE1_004280 [Barthelona sp. PCE]
MGSLNFIFLLLQFTLLTAISVETRCESGKLKNDLAPCLNEEKLCRVKIYEASYCELDDFKFEVKSVKIIIDADKSLTIRFNNVSIAGQITILNANTEYFSSSINYLELPSNNSDFTLIDSKLSCLDSFGINIATIQNSTLNCITNKYLLWANTFSVLDNSFISGYSIASDDMTILDTKFTEITIGFYGKYQISGSSMKNVIFKAFGSGSDLIGMEFSGRVYIESVVSITDSTFTNVTDGLIQINNFERNIISNSELNIACNIFTDNTFTDSKCVPTYMLPCINIRGNVKNNYFENFYHEQSAYFATLIGTNQNINMVNNTFINVNDFMLMSLNSNFYVEALYIRDSEIISVFASTSPFDVKAVNIDMYRVNCSLNFLFVYDFVGLVEIQQLNVIDCFFNIPFFFGNQTSDFVIHVDDSYFKNSHISSWASSMDTTLFLKNCTMESINMSHLMFGITGSLLSMDGVSGDITVNRVLGDCELHVTNSPNLSITSKLAQIHSTGCETSFPINYDNAVTLVNIDDKDWTVIAKQHESCLLPKPYREYDYSTCLQIEPMFLYLNMIKEKYWYIVATNPVAVTYTNVQVQYMKHNFTIPIVPKCSFFYSNRDNSHFCSMCDPLTQIFVQEKGFAFQCVDSTTFFKGEYYLTPGSLMNFSLAYQADTVMKSIKVCAYSSFCDGTTMSGMTALPMKYVEAFFPGFSKKGLWDYYNYKRNEETNIIPVRSINGCLMNRYGKECILCEEKDYNTGAIMRPAIYSAMCYTCPGMLESSIWLVGYILIAVVLFKYFHLGFKLPWTKIFRIKDDDVLDHDIFNHLTVLFKVFNNVLPGIIVLFSDIDKAGSLFPSIMTVASCIFGGDMNTSSFVHFNALAIIVNSIFIIILMIFFFQDLFAGLTITGAIISIIMFIVYTFTGAFLIFYIAIACAVIPVIYWVYHGLRMASVTRWFLAPFVFILTPFIKIKNSKEYWKEFFTRSLLIKKIFFLLVVVFYPWILTASLHVFVDFVYITGFSLSESKISLVQMFINIAVLCINIIVLPIRSGFFKSQYFIGLYTKGYEQGHLFIDFIWLFLRIFVDLYTRLYGAGGTYFTAAYFICYAIYIYWAQPFQSKFINSAALSIFGLYFLTRFGYDCFVYVLSGSQFKSLVLYSMGIGLILVYIIHRIVRNVDQKYSAGQSHFDNDLYGIEMM